MTDQWGRAYEIDVGVTDLLGFGGFRLSSEQDGGGLRVAFTVTRDEEPEPNTAELSIWNLNPDHRKWLQDQAKVPVRISAGYVGATGLLFAGVLRDVRTDNDGPDKVTVLSAGDGEAGDDGTLVAAVKIHRTFSRGTPVLALITALVDACGLGAGNLPIFVPAAAAQAIPGGVLSNALTVSGSAYQELAEWLAALGLVWSVQDGKVQARLSGVPMGLVPLISPANGLIGSPAKETEKQDDGTKKTVLSGTCLMLPSLLPGYLFNVQSDQITGSATCRLVTHTGDTAGDWTTYFEGV